MKKNKIQLNEISAISIGAKISRQFGVPQESLKYTHTFSFDGTRLNRVKALYFYCVEKYASDSFVPFDYIAISNQVAKTLTKAEVTEIEVELLGIRRRPGERRMKARGGGEMEGGVVGTNFFAVKPDTSIPSTHSSEVAKNE